MTDFGGRAEADRLHRIGWPEPVPNEEQEPTAETDDEAAARVSADWQRGER